jgi:D-3-phosphoglycerate dehydrogenase
VRLALAGELVPDAVNVSGGVIAEDVRPGIPLAEKLGRVFTALAGGVPTQFDVDVRGEITEHDVTVLQLAALKGCSETSSRSRCRTSTPRCWLRSAASTSGSSPTRSARSSGTSSRCAEPSRTGTRVSVAGTLTGPKQVEKLVGVDGLDLETAARRPHARARYTDRPGVVGSIGGLLGTAGVNIAAMQVARAAEGGEAVGVLTLDQSVPAPVLDELVARSAPAPAVWSSSRSDTDCTE